MPLILRAYEASDQAGCVAVFRSNTPEFFAASEEAEFAHFLDNRPGPYFVFELDGRIVACGGYATGPLAGQAALCWGMVARDRQREGFGGALTDFRLDVLAVDPAVQYVTIETSQHTAAFFERFGFATESVAKDGFSPGIDRVKMKMEIASRLPT
ncbi:MAG: GNAT family N-acetyltransferase [Acidobacteria bacterium]|nr:GNAT family N-acetyltransferase [Acidobacteriota bacterium]